MDLTLTHSDYRSDGIFGALASTDGSFSCVTLEHAYLTSSGSFGPKIPPGNYVCQRGVHQLAGMTHTFVTFEITGVAGHTNLLFHFGNFNRDSEGCILLGEAVADYSQGEMITNSDATFQKFMEAQSGVDSFTLTVVA